jgi:hypothetical protein
MLLKGSSILFGRRLVHPALPSVLQGQYRPETKAGNEGDPGASTDRLPGRYVTEARGLPGAKEGRGGRDYGDQLRNDDQSLAEQSSPFGIGVVHPFPPLALAGRLGVTGNRRLASRNLDLAARR